MDSIIGGIVTFVIVTSVGLGVMIIPRVKPEPPPPTPIIIEIKKPDDKPKVEKTVEDIQAQKAVKELKIKVENIQTKADKLERLLDEKIKK